MPAVGEDEVPPELLSLAFRVTVWLLGVERRESVEFRILEVAAM